MDEFQTGEETAFVVDEVSNIIKESIEGSIGGNAYQHNKVNQWTSNVVEQCLNQLTKLGKPFKYIVTCVIMQKNGAGLHTASSCFWDNTTDGSCTVRWENKTMYCIVSVFGLAIWSVYYLDYLPLTPHKDNGLDPLPQDVPTFTLMSVTIWLTSSHVLLYIYLNLHEPFSIWALLYDNLYVYYQLYFIVIWIIYISFYNI